MKLMATFVLGCNIVIGSFTITRAHSMKVVSSWRELGNTATIQLPLIAFKEKYSVGGTLESNSSKMKEGDLVEIKMSYIGIHKTYEYNEFKGFVKRISPNVPLTIECEDAVYLLRRTNLTKEWKSKTTLKEVINYIVAETNKVSKYKITLSDSIPDINFEKFRLDKINAAQALQKLKESFGLVAYFDELKLVVGLAYTQGTGKVKYNLMGNIIKSNLVYRRKEDIIIRLKAVGILKDNTKVTVNIPEADNGGEQRTFFTYKATDKASLKLIAEAYYKNLAFEGYEGNIETFLVPPVKHSMAAQVVDPNYKDRDGSYLVDKVETTYGDTIRRHVYLGIKLS